MAKRGWRTQQEKLDALIKRYKDPTLHACGHSTRVRHIASGTCYECWLERSNEHERLIRKFKNDR